MAAFEPMLCSRLTTDTGAILELWELDDAFELLGAEAHRPDEVVSAVTPSLVEVELLAEKLAQAAAAVRND